MANKTNVAFDPSKSSRARQLSNLSSREVFERYFVEDNNITWLKDFNRELNRTKANDEDQYYYTYLVSLMGEALNFIPTLINTKIAPFVPVGYKLNSKAMAEDLEAILAEHPNETRIAANNDQVNDFVIEVTEFITKLCNKGIEYKSGLSV